MPKLIALAAFLSGFAHAQTWSERTQAVLENVTNQSLTEIQKSVLQNDIAQIGPEPSEEYTYLACVHGNFHVSLYYIGVDLMGCYDWQKGQVYTIGGASLGLARGFATGAGLLIVSHPVGGSIEGVYICGSAGAAMGWTGGKILACGSTTQSPGKQTIVFVGYQAGQSVSVDGEAITVNKY